MSSMSSVVKAGPPRCANSCRPVLACHDNNGDQMARWKLTSILDEQDVDADGDDYVQTYDPEDLVERYLCQACARVTVQRMIDGGYDFRVERLDDGDWEAPPEGVPEVGAHMFGKSFASSEREE